jgi:oligopeptidase B
MIRESIIIFGWMIEKIQVIDYLNKENEYYQNMTADQTVFKKKCLRKWKAKEDDESVPYLYNGVLYNSFWNR